MKPAADASASTRVTNARNRFAVCRGFRCELLQQRLSDLADTFCEGTTSPLMLALVEGSQLSPNEIAQLRELLDRLSAEKPGRKKKGGKP